MSELSALRAELKNIAAVIRETYLHGHFTQEQESIVFSLGKLTLRCTSSDLMGPFDPISKRHFSACCFSSVTC